MVTYAEEVEAPLCVIRRSPGMVDLERRLRHAMVAYVGGSRPEMTCDQVSMAIAARMRVSVNQFSVHRYLPEDFLVVFAIAELRNRVAVLPYLEHGGFSLYFRQWTRQAQATRVVMRTWVYLVLEGVPPHA
jgi:hypothetical protein